MKTVRLANISLGVCFLLPSIISCNKVEKPGTNQKASFIDVSKARVGIEALDKQFSEDFRNKDSVALADYYTSDGMLGSVTGKDNLVSTWSKMIKSAAENGTPDLTFTISSFASDDEYVVELGSYQFVDKDGTVKSQGKYLVAWKQEGGQWKIYRDVGL